MDFCYRQTDFSWQDHPLPLSGSVSGKSPQEAGALNCRGSSDKTPPDPRLLQGLVRKIRYTCVTQSRRTCRVIRPEGRTNEMPAMPKPLSFLCISGRSGIPGKAAYVSNIAVFSSSGFFFINFVYIESVYDFTALSSRRDLRTFTAIYSNWKSGESARRSHREDRK